MRLYPTLGWIGLALVAGGLAVRAWEPAEAVGGWIAWGGAGALALFVALGARELGARLAEWWRRARTFLAEVRNEMGRVTWPTRREVWATTLVVILASMFFGLYLFAIDIVLNRVVAWIFRSFGAA
ncbi:MAG TPA: preprotein translocase subunit SecE [Vicinamibacterales bacterium]|jgi:preprotein translocase subunit SecE|nr:preprotein translocase subunit SecE [Vicinamibacterales bacterium]